MSILKSTRTRETAPQSARSLSHLASRLFNVPLAIERNKLDVILYVLGPRLNLYSLPQVSGSMLSERDDRQPYQITSDGIALIDVADTLVRRASGLDAMSGLTSYEQLQAELVGAINDPKVKGVLATFDSPGGEVGGLFDLVDCLYSLRGTKPLYAAVSEMACSAAYALASACDRIFMTRTAAVGSIGVYALHVDESKSDQMQGLKYTYVYAGEKKIDGNPHEPLSTSAKAEFQAQIDWTYDLFVDSVARNRRISPKQVRDTEAGQYFGQDAVANGLADQIGTPEQALDALRSAIAAKASAGFSAHAERPDITLKSTAQLAVEMALAQLPAADASAPNSTDEKENNLMAQLNPADATLDPQAKAAPPCEETKAKKAAAEPKDEPDGDEEDEPDGDEPDDEEKPADKKGKAKGKKASAVRLASADRLEIREYCKLAGREALALEFIGKGMTVEEVCSQLTDLRAKESDSLKLTSHVNPLNDGQSVQSLDSEAAQYAQQNGITKEQAYAKMLQANPQVYEAFSRQHSAKALRFRLGETVSLD